LGIERGGKRVGNTGHGFEKIASSEPKESFFCLHYITLDILVRAEMEAIAELTPLQLKCNLATVTSLQQPLALER
jgi:hypothetical protein